MQAIQPDSNETSEAPQENSGAFPVARNLEAPVVVTRQQRPRPTAFPPEIAINSLRTLLYNAYRHEFGGAPLSRWLIILLFAIAFFWATGLLPGRWWVSGAALLLAIGLIATIATLRKRGFVHFKAEARPEIVAAKLPPNDKIAVNVTGLFSVEGQEARYTGLPGFYRTFATREHALLCLVRDRRFLKIGRWPAMPTGMWYIFFTPQITRAFSYGQLHFGKQPTPAIAVDYEIVIPKSSRFRRDKIVNETIYIACQNEQDAARILADLMADENNT